MKKSVCVWLAVLLLLTACSQSAAATWQEQYDLGVRYLSEGKYEEAVIAFNAAIEIDPKRADAYLGLADAYEAQGDTELARQVLADALAVVTDAGVIRSRLDGLGAGAVPETTPGPAAELGPTHEPTGTVVASGDIILFSEYNIENFVTEEEFTIGGVPFYELTIDEAVGLLPELDRSTGPDGVGGTRDYTAWIEFSDDAFYAGIGCQQYGGSQTINTVIYRGGFYERVFIDERVKTEIRGISIGDSMEIVLEKIGIPADLIEALVQRDFEITIHTEHSGDNGYGRIDVDESLFGIYGYDGPMIRIMADHSTCTMGFIENQLFMLDLIAQ